MELYIEADAAFDVVPLICAASRFWSHLKVSVFIWTPLIIYWCLLISTSSNLLLSVHITRSVLKKSNHKAIISRILAIIVFCFLWVQVSVCNIEGEKQGKKHQQCVILRCSFFCRGKHLLSGVVLYGFC